MCIDLRFEVGCTNVRRDIAEHEALLKTVCLFRDAVVSHKSCNKISSKIFPFVKFMQSELVKVRLTGSCLP